MVGFQIPRVTSQNVKVVSTPGLCASKWVCVANKQRGCDISQLPREGGFYPRWDGPWGWSRRKLLHDMQQITVDLALRVCVLWVRPVSSISLCSKKQPVV